MKPRIGSRLSSVLCAVALAGGTARASAQSAQDQTKTPAATVQEHLKRMAAHPEPVRRAGLRSSVLAQIAQILDVVVIAESESAYLDALAAWEWPARFPILYDDGSDRARELIARFVRGFRPERIVRLEGQGEVQWPSDARERRELVDSVIGKALRDSAPTSASVLGAMHQGGISSPGIVVIDPDSGAWMGGAALAAGRVQRALLLGMDLNPHADVSQAQGDALARSIETAIKSTGLSWSEIGDDIDAVTLAMGIGVRVKGEGDEIHALTDRIGHHGPGGRGERWGWSGQLVGSAPECVYQAMCSLFLGMDSAWVWDGYEDTGDWARFDGTEAAEVLRGLGWDVDLHDEPRNSLRAFELTSAGVPVDAGLLLMNSKGSRVHFDLPGSPSGSGRPGDLPVLERPSALHMVHSFSLANPLREGTVGSRWLERGVYLYAGSVDEPFLNGFVPTPIVAKRLGAGLAFAGAVHYDGAPVWKITVIGDPLKTIGPPGQRVSLESVGASIDGVDIAQRAKERLKESDFEGAASDFVMTGDDKAVARLAKALVSDKPELITDGFVNIAIHSASRELDFELVLDLFERLGPGSKREAPVLDALWLAGRSRLARFDDRRALALMRANLRDQMRVRDAQELADHLRDKDSLQSGIALLESLRPIMIKGEIAKLDRAIERMRR